MARGQLLGSIVVTVAVVAGGAWLLAQLLAVEPADQTSRPSPRDVYDPVRAGEEQPPGFRQLLPRDGIPPVYDPSFVDPGGVDWPDDTLVIGVALDQEAKAYPVSYLNRREMVIDRVAGIPVLVTW